MVEEQKIDGEGKVIVEEKPKLMGKFFKKKEQVEPIVVPAVDPQTEELEKPLEVEEQKEGVSKEQIARLAYAYLSYEELLGLLNQKYSAVLLENEQLTSLAKKIMLRGEK